MQEIEQRQERLPRARGEGNILCSPPLGEGDRKLLPVFHAIDYNWFTDAAALAAEE